MSTEQKQQAQELYTENKEALKWWEGLEWKDKNNIYKSYLPDDWAFGKEVTMGMITEMYKSEIEASFSSEIKQTQLKTTANNKD